MVLVERNSENVRNGRRSRGPSPNGQQGGTPDTSSDDDSTKKIGNKSSKAKSEYEEKIRVGRDYQVQCPDLVPTVERKLDALADRALLVWSPTKDIPESKLEDYISVAKEKYGYNGEQALGMLFWHKHDLERAVLDLANFTPFPDEWSVEDRVLFDQAFQFHGKSFHRIRQMLPDKTIASLVKYYYSWKKTRSRTSVMDRQEKLKAKEGSENGSENGSNEESDSDEKKWSMHRGIQRATGGSPTMASIDDQLGNSFVAPAQILAIGNAANSNNSVKMDQSTTKNSDTSTKSVLNTSNTCFGCGVTCSFTSVSPHGALCNSCFHHWRRTGSLRPTSGPCSGKRSRSVGVERYKRKPPRGMYINHDDIVALAGPAANSPNSHEDPLNTMDREIVSLLTQIQRNKQGISFITREYADSIDTLRPNDATTRINPRWNSEEHQLAVQGIRKFGKDFTAIAEMIGTKTEVHLRTFFVNYRRKLNLDNLLKEFDENQRKVANNLHVGTSTTATPDVMEVDCDEVSSIIQAIDDDIEEVLITDEPNLTIKSGARLPVDDEMEI